MASVLPRLGVNIDHVATLRELRGTPYPDLLEAARGVAEAGGSQITVHLREDRRHIQDADVKRLRGELPALGLPLNLEMSLADEIVRFACRTAPDWACLVPEKRDEITTEGGLDLAKHKKKAAGAIAKLKKAGVKVSCFVEPSLQAVRLSAELGADAVELHTGRFCLAKQGAFKGRSRQIAQFELKRIRAAAEAARKAGLKAHAGHGFDFVNVREVVALDLIEEYNIGHAIVCRAALVGMTRAVREMVSAITAP